MKVHLARCDNVYTKAWWFLGLMIMGSVLPAQAAICTLSWEANTETDLAGYYAFQTASGVSYPSAPAWIGNVTSVTCEQLGATLSGTTYYFHVRAYDTEGNVSEPSNEASFTVPMPPPVPMGLRVTEVTGSSAKAEKRKIEVNRLER